MPNAGEDAEKQKLLFITGGNAEQSTFEDHLAVAHKAKYSLTI